MHDSGLRLRLILGKFRVVHVDEVTRITGGTTKRATIELADGYRMVISNIPMSADVRYHDLITFYGEVPTNAPSLPPPV